MAAGFLTVWLARTNWSTAAWAITNSPPHPEDANAEANLGGALAETGHWKEARTHLEKALMIDPNNTLARENLEQVKREAPRDKE